VLHVAFFGEMCRGNIIEFGGYQPIQGIAFAEIRVGARTKAAITASVNVIPLWRAMKQVHGTALPFCRVLGPGDETRNLHYKP